MIIRQLMDGLYLGSVVEGALQANMGRFKAYGPSAKFSGGLGMKSAQIDKTMGILKGMQPTIFGTPHLL